ncbi:type II/IV secretion system protein [Candidatus Saccharibacteria bacterium]|nr:type II/IV secretion system protein [Candidatus Saccharibacteria bacterium]
MSQDVRQGEERITQQRAGLLGIDYVDTSALAKQLYKDILSDDELTKLRVVPLQADEHSIRFGITNTTSQQTLHNLEARFTDQRVTFALISESGYRDYIALYFPPEKVVYQDISVTREDNRAMIAEVSRTLATVRPDDMLGYLVQQAYQLKASDIHLECQKQDVRVRFRVDGVLHPIATIDYEKYGHLVSAIASAANITTIAEDSQQGHIARQYKLATGEEVTVNLRVETVPSFYGMDIVMRLFNLKLEMFNLDRLSLSEAERQVVDGIIKRPTGMVIVVGPTGSGKTTTLYSMLNTLNSAQRKLITLEDPVEYNLPGVTQIPVKGELQGLKFAEKLRAILRLDPDIVMVGEIRDPDTAKTALQGALTGHLVLTTFHANSAAAALTRLLDMIGINPLFASAIRLIMAQRLVRQLDDDTKQVYEPDESLRQKLTEIIDGLPPGITKPEIKDIKLYKAGSSKDNPFGYGGVLPLREQLLMTAGVQDILKLPPAQITTEVLQAQAINDGMRTMLQDGVLKAIAGQTTIEEVFRVVD